MSTEERLERIERLLLISAKEALTVPEAALMIGVGESRIRHLASERNIPYYKRGKNLFFSKSELVNWMLQDRIPTNAEIDSKASTHVVTTKF